MIFKGADIPALAQLFHDQSTGIAKFVYRATFTRADGLLLGAFVAVTQREVSHPVSVAWRRLRFPIFVATALALAGLYVLGERPQRLRPSRHGDRVRDARALLRERASRCARTR